MIKNVTVDGGPVMKRIRPVGMGRAYLIRKRTAHVTVQLAEDLIAKARREKLARQLAEKTAKKKVAGKASIKAKAKSPPGE